MPDTDLREIAQRGIAVIETSRGDISNEEIARVFRGYLDLTAPLSLKCEKYMQVLQMAVDCNFAATFPVECLTEFLRWGHACLRLEARVKELEMKLTETRENLRLSREMVKKKFRGMT